VPPGESARSSTITVSTPASAAVSSTAGKGRNEQIRSSPDALALVAELVDRVLDGPRSRSERDDHAIRIVEPVLLERA